MMYFYFVYIVVYVFFFFFQAEDGIRDTSVTGVQTCALPISLVQKSEEMGFKTMLLLGGSEINSLFFNAGLVDELWLTVERSEERRVGKECRSRWWRGH